MKIIINVTQTTHELKSEMLVSFSTHAHDDLIRANLAVRSITHPQSFGPWSALSHLPL